MQTSIDAVKAELRKEQTHLAQVQSKMAAEKLSWAKERGDLLAHIKKVGYQFLLVQGNQCQRFGMFVRLEGLSLNMHQDTFKPFFGNPLHGFEVLVQWNIATHRIW